MRRTVGASRAFTLVEVLVALVIFALLSAGVYSHVYGALKLWRQWEADDDLNDTAERAIELIATDARAIFFLPDNDATQLNGSEQEISFCIVAADGQVEIRRYAYSEEEQSSGALMRYSRRLAVSPRPAADTAETVTETVMHTRARSLLFSYYDVTMQRWLSSWSDAGTLPVLIKIAAEFRETRGEKVFVVERFVRIPAALRRGGVASGREDTEHPESAGTPESNDGAGQQ